MKKLYVTPDADLDVEEQFDHYVVTVDLELAKRFYYATYQTFDKLLETPFIGNQRHSHNLQLKDLRRWFVQGFEKHQIFYRIVDDTVEIVRVLHSARDIERVFDEI